MAYRVRAKHAADKEQIKQTKTLNEALETASILMNYFSTPENRTGSLRGDGEVIMWKDGERIGYVIVEKMLHGVFEKIGG